MKSFTLTAETCYRYSHCGYFMIYPLRYSYGKPTNYYNPTGYKSNQMQKAPPRAPQALPSQGLPPPSQGLPQFGKTYGRLPPSSHGLQPPSSHGLSGSGQYTYGGDSNSFRNPQPRTPVVQQNMFGTRGNQAGWIHR
jgi:hypothetical protein